MKNLIIATTIIFILLVKINLYAQTLYNGVGHIPAYYQENWNEAGLLQNMSSVEPKLIIVITPGSATSQVTTALNTARDHVNTTNGLAIIFFPEGTFNFSSPITVTQNERNIVFQGAGSDKTTLVFQNLKNSHCFNIAGTAGAWSSSSDLDQTFDKGESILHSAPGGGLNAISAGDWVHFIKRYFDYNDENADIIEDIVGQITRLDAKGNDATGEWGEIKDEANMNYVDSPNTLYSLRIRKITPVMNIGIENLKIMRSPFEKSTSGYPNNIILDFAINCWIKGVESYKPSRNHLSVSHSSHILISGCYFHEAMDYEGGGWGYGVCLESSTTNSLVENNIFQQLRHSLIAAAGSNCNVWTFNYSREQHSTGLPPTYRDLDLHAKYPFGHLFEHNMIEEIGADSHHGDNGPYNAFVRNYSYDGNMDLEKMKYWSSLGNIKTANPLYAPYQTYDEPPITDRFGFRNNYLLGVIHNSVSYYPSDGNACELKDVSYYYSTRPDFLPSSSYSWPALGCNYYYGIQLTQSIPAKDRFNQTKKTYLPNPTLPLITTTGTMFFNQTWSGTVSLTGNVTVSTGVTLTLAANSTLNMNSYYIKCSGTGKIVKNSTATINNYTNYAKSGSDYKGFFPTSITIPQVVSWASSGWNIYVGSTASAQVINIDTQVPTGITVTFNTGSRMNMYAKLYTTTGTITVQSGATISPNIRRTNAWSSIKGLHPTIASAITDAAANDNVVLGSGTFAENVTMKSDCKLRGNTASTTTLNGTITLNNTSTSQIHHLKVNQDIIVHSCSNISIYDLIAKDIIDIENGSNIQIFDTELANYGYMDIYQSAPHMQNITSTYNLTSGVVCGDADYTMEDGLFSNKTRALNASISDLTIIDTQFCNNTFDIYCSSSSSANVSADDEADITMSSCPPPIYGSVTLNDPCSACVGGGGSSSSESLKKENTLPLEGADGSPEGLEYAELRNQYRAIQAAMRQDRKDSVKYDIIKYAPKYNQVITGMKAFVAKYPDSEYAQHALKFIA